MKTYTFSKQDIDYLQPIDATMNGLNVAIQVYVVNQVFKRLGLAPATRARYDLAKGELYVEEPKDAEAPAGAVKAPVKPESVLKPTIETTTPPKP